jgi:hypothetical protein
VCECLGKEVGLWWVTDGTTWDNFLWLVGWLVALLQWHSIWDSRLIAYSIALNAQMILARLWLCAPVSRSRTSAVILLSVIGNEEASTLS